MLDWIEFLVPALPKAKAASTSMRELLEDHRSGNLNYGYLVRKAAEIYAKCVEGVAVPEVVQLALRFAERDRGNLFVFAQHLLEQARKKDYSIVIVSGAPLEVIQAYQYILPIDQVFAVVIERHGTVFGGNIVANHGLTEKKKEVMTKLIGAGYRIALAVGNSMSDLPLLEFAECGFLIANDQEISDSVRASCIDIEQASTTLLEVL